MQDVLAQLYALAEPQGGYFTTAQASAEGVQRQYLQHHLKKGRRLIRVAHGIYRLAQFPGQPFEDMIVACLWAGPDCVVSHESALAVYGLADAMPSSVHITTRPLFRGRRPGVVLHPGILGADERTTRERVPVTSAERTLADIERQQPAVAHELVAEAIARGFTSERKLTRYAQAHAASTVSLSAIEGLR